ncbi:Casein kinase I-2-like protein [Hordeum vulgare]|nr:Casein kinase I-2-like protein [Hordeum vulgare]
MRLTREALAMLDIPLQLATVLPGRGWRPPEQDQVKINIDATTLQDEGKSKAGGVARAPTTFLGAWCKLHPGVTDPMIAEALAVRDGVIFVNLKGYSNIVMETDSLDVINLWNHQFF